MISKVKFFNFLHGFINRIKDTTHKSYAYPYRRITYSQEGEDLILYELLGSKFVGKYIDIGAFHPMKYSNTYLFYSHGWQGINIDANPNFNNIFTRYRPRDINIEACISSECRNVKYYRFVKEALNTISEKEAYRKIDMGFELKDVLEMSTKRLMDIVSISQFAEMTFMTVDVEGHELEVLKSVDWAVVSPPFLLVEVLNHQTIEELYENKVVSFLREVGYQIVARTSRTVFFKKMK